MNKTAAFQTAVCTLAISALSAGTTTVIVVANTAFDLIRIVGAVACFGAGTWLVYLGHCKSMLPR